MNESSTTSELDILTEVINFGEGNLPVELAKLILDWKFSDSAIQRMNELAEKNALGTITPAERADLEKYLRVGGFVNIVQAKARQSMSPPSCS